MENQHTCQLSILRNRYTYVRNIRRYFVRNRYLYVHYIRTATYPTHSTVAHNRYTYVYIVPIATYVLGSTVFSTASTISTMCTNQHTMQAVLFSEPLHLYDIYISIFWIVCTFLATATSNERHCYTSTKKIISNTRDSATMTVIRNNTNNIQASYTPRKAYSIRYENYNKSHNN